MLILLQDFDRFRWVAQWNKETGELTWQPRDNFDADVLSTVNGHIAQLGQTTLILYREGPQLLLHIADQSIALSARVKVMHQCLLDCTLTIVIGQEVRWKIIYRRPLLSPTLEADPTPFIDEEDHDFGLFLENVSNSTERQGRLYKSAQ
jgi:hypothetical protein